MTVDLQAIKENYDSMDWEDFLNYDGELTQNEIDIYDAVVIEGVPALIAEVERLRKALQTIVCSPKIEQLCEMEAYAELVLEGRENEFKKCSLPPTEVDRLQWAISNIKRVCEQSENSDTQYIKRIIDELEGE